MALIWIVADAPDAFQLAGGLEFEADTLVAQGNHAAAEDRYLRAIAILERTLPADSLGQAHPADKLASLYLQQQRYDEAEPLLRRVLAIVEPTGIRGWGGRLLYSLGVVCAEQGRFPEAEALLDRSVARFEEELGPESFTVAEPLNGLAMVRWNQARVDEALAASRRAVAIMSRHVVDEIAKEAGQSRLPGVAYEVDPELVRQKYRRFYLFNALLAHVAGGRDGVAEAFQSVQWAQASSAGRALSAMATRFAAGDSALAAVVRERQDLNDRWQRLNEEYSRFSYHASEDQQAESYRRRAEVGAAGQRLTALDAQISREFPRFAELGRSQALGLDAVQALLAPDEAMLVYVVMQHESWLFVVRRHHAAKIQELPGRAWLDGHVTALRARLDPDRNPDFEPFEAARAHALYRAILEPAVPLLDGVRQLYVVPEGPLESLPFGVLVTQPPAAGTDPRDVAWLARDRATVVLPSVGSLRALRAFAAPSGATQPFLGIGDPLLEGQPGAGRGIKAASLFRGALADVDAVRKLTRLSETADELRAVAAVLGAGEDHLYLGERAAEPLVRGADLTRYRVIEFATHGLVSGELKGLAEPALVLTPPRVASRDDDGLLTASEIATLKLDADWVVLSACNTAAGDGTPDAGGLSGLAKAFFYAGARALLVSHWSVPSEATVKLVTGTFAALDADRTIGRAEALRRAQMAMLDDRSLPVEFTHPMAWAPFVLAGEGGRR